MPRGIRRFIAAALVVSGGVTAWLFVGSREDSPRAREAVPVSSARTETRQTPAAVAPVVTATAPAPAKTPPGFGQGVVALHELPVDVPLIAVAQHAGDPSTLQNFRVRLGPDRFVDVDVARFDALNDDEGVYSGSVRGERDSQAVFSYVGLAHAGTVVLPDEERAFYITATEHGQMRITELDLNRAPLCGQPLLAQGAPAAH
jgi:hypothetical protein